MTVATVPVVHENVSPHADVRGGTRIAINRVALQSRNHQVQSFAAPVELGIY